IIAGSILGLFFTKIPERYKTTVMHGIGLAVILIGLQMAFSTEVIIVVLLSMLSGALIGELFVVEEKLNRLGTWIGNIFASADDHSGIAQSFVTASLIFGIGSMTTLWALDSGIHGDHEVLLTKSVLDGFV